MKSRTISRGLLGRAFFQWSCNACFLNRENVFLCEGYAGDRGVLDAAEGICG